MSLHRSTWQACYLSFFKWRLSVSSIHHERCCGQVDHVPRQQREPSIASKVSVVASLQATWVMSSPCLQQIEWIVPLFPTQALRSKPAHHWSPFSDWKVETCCAILFSNQILFPFRSDKDRRTDSRIRRKKKHSAAPPGGGFFSSDPAVSSSIFVGAKREENLIWNFPTGATLQVCFRFLGEGGGWEYKKKLYLFPKLLQTFATAPDGGTVTKHSGWAEKRDNCLL